MTKICVKCTKTKSLSDFYVNRNKCKKCCCKDAINWQSKNKDKVRKHLRKYQAKWRVKNAKIYKIQHNKRSKQHYLANKKYYNAKTRLREKRIRNAMPKWLTTGQIEEMKNFYKNCPEGFHVDHIIPLKGKNISGLHVPSNLQYLHAKENLSKSNKF